MLLSAPQLIILTLLSLAEEQRQMLNILMVTFFLENVRRQYNYYASLHQSATNSIFKRIYNQWKSLETQRITSVD